MRSWALVAVVLLSVTAEPALAADVTYDGAGMTIAGAGEASRLSVRFDPGIAATVHDDAATLRAGLGCLGTTRDVTCGLLGPQCYPCSARIGLGDGNDTLTLTGTSQKGPFLVDAGGGDDEVHIAGDTNAIVDGGPGRDSLRADAVSELDGGDGPDELHGDRAIASYAKRGDGVTVTLDGIANDGASGEGDNAMTGSVVGSEGPDALTGNAAANELGGRGGADALNGAGGADSLHGDAGVDRIDGGLGDDRIQGSRDDAVRCGAGTDVAIELLVPGSYADCETVFETSAEEPDLTVSDIAVSKRRPNVTLGWHEYPGATGPGISAAGIVELRVRGLLVARGAFAGLDRPAQRAVALRLTSRGKRLACRSARNVRLLVVATGQTAAPVNLSSRSAIRRDARLPRVGSCARRR